MSTRELCRAFRVSHETPSLSQGTHVIGLQYLVQQQNGLYFVANQIGNTECVIAMVIVKY